MESYIVRVYRRDDQRLDEVVGMVEMVGWNGRRPFHSLSELCEILSLCPEDACKTDALPADDETEPVSPAVKPRRR